MTEEHISQILDESEDECKETGSVVDSDDGEIGSVSLRLSLQMG